MRQKSIEALSQSDDVGDEEDEPVRPDRGVEDGERLHPDRRGGGGEPGDQEELFTHSDNCGGKHEQRQGVIPCAGGDLCGADHQQGAVHEGVHPGKESC